METGEEKSLSPTSPTYCRHTRMPASLSVWCHRANHRIHQLVLSLSSSARFKLWLWLFCLSLHLWMYTQHKEAGMQRKEGQTSHSKKVGEINFKLTKCTARPWQVCHQYACWLFFADDINVSPLKRLHSRQLLARFMWTHVSWQGFCALQYMLRLYNTIILRPVKTT